jgi:hypothetical protein
LADHFCRSSIGVLAALAALGIGPAAAQDFTAGKTPAQLFQSDCTACHKSPAGLAKGRDARGLTSFLKEHYTTKEESAAALASYLVGSGPGPAEGRPKPQTPAVASPGPNPAAPPPAKPKPAARSAEGETETNTNAPHEERRAAHTPAAAHEGARPEGDETIRKLNAYAGSGGAASDTERGAETTKKLQSYAGSGAGADALTPADDAVKPAPAEKKKKKGATSASAPPAPANPAAPAARASAPRRPAAPTVAPHPPGNN